MMYYVTVKTGWPRMRLWTLTGQPGKTAGSMSVVGITPGVLEVVRRVMAEDGMASRM